MNLQTNELIDDYLLGRLSPPDAEAFEQQVKANPELANELAIQNDIINGISNTRRVALKARLNNLEIPKGNWFTNNATWLSVSAGVIVLTILAFLYQNNTSTTVQTAETPQIPQKEQNQTAKEGATKTNPSLPQETLASSSPAQEAPTKKGNVTKPAFKKEVRNKEVSSNEANSDLSDPAVTKFEDETVLASKKGSGEEKEVEATKPVAKTAQTLNAETITNSNQYTYHYKRNETRLTLYGNFSEKAYEVLEISGKSGTNYFMFHNGNYFSLASTDGEIRSLTPLTDEATIKKLANLRKRK